MLDVHALDRADALREHECLRLRERCSGEPPAVVLPYERRVETLLDRGPDREGRREVVTRYDEVAPVAHADLVDGVEEMVGGVAGEDVGQAGLDAHAHQREPAPLAPAIRHRELRGAEHLPRLLVGAFGVGLGQRHRHVDVVTVRIEGCCEYRRIEAWVARVQHDVDTFVGREFADGGRFRRVELAR